MSENQETDALDAVYIILWDGVVRDAWLLQGCHIHPVTTT